eukprot:m.45907 g.45907  ORF g.45907 m.45907 type:complete len:238 (-) comp14712_c1_seq1:31-744(-)
MHSFPHENKTWASTFLPLPLQTSHPFRRTAEAMSKPEQMEEEHQHLGLPVPIQERIVYWKKRNTVKAVWLSLCSVAGGAAARESVLAHLTSIGVVSALLAGLFFGGLDSPPEVVDLDIEDTQPQLLAVFLSGSLLLELMTVSICVTMYAYASLVHEDEMAAFLDSFAFLLATLPVITMTLGFLLGLAATVLRLKIVWGSPAWQVFVGVTSAALLVVLVLLLRMEAWVQKTRFSRMTK